MVSSICLLFKILNLFSGILIGKHYIYRPFASRYYGEYCHNEFRGLLVLPVSTLYID